MHLLVVSEWGNLRFKNYEKVLICLSTITVTSNTVAANWGFFLESNGVKQYLDRDSLNIDSKKNTVSYWEKREGKLGTEKERKLVSI